MIQEVDITHQVVVVQKETVVHHLHVEVDVVQQVAVVPLDVEVAVVVEVVEVKNQGYGTNNS
jgi:hypothetical protein